jgi:hypothetical protein
MGTGPESLGDSSPACISSHSPDRSIVVISNEPKYEPGKLSRQAIFSEQIKCKTIEKIKITLDMSRKIGYKRLVGY